MPRFNKSLVRHVVELNVLSRMLLESDRRHSFTEAQRFLICGFIMLRLVSTTDVMDVVDLADDGDVSLVVLSCIAQRDPKFYNAEIMQRLWGGIPPHPDEAKHTQYSTQQEDKKEWCIKNGVMFPVDKVKSFPVASRDARTCIVCCENHCNAVFSCGHNVMCMRCAEQHVTSDQKCPVCRRVTERVTFFYATDT